VAIVLQVDAELRVDGHDGDPPSFSSSPGSLRDETETGHWGTGIGRTAITAKDAKDAKGPPPMAGGPFASFASLAVIRFLGVAVVKAKSAEAICPLSRSDPAVSPFRSVPIVVPTDPVSRSALREYATLIT